MPGSILGTAVRRVEDPDLLLGRAQFVDDLAIDGILELAFVRSPYAHARIVSVDVDDARRGGAAPIPAAGDRRRRSGGAR
jgi:carbon-monoxide dehydrogenase large subunit